MAEYIGSRISLISKRDIRYVGTLHEISSENSTVALEQVKSFGTEGRDPDNEILPSDNVYEYIVFRGSDVKDLRIEKEPEKKPAQQPQVPDDPAILGNARPVGAPSYQPTQKQQSQQQTLPQQSQQPVPAQQQQQRFPQQLPPGQGPPRFQNHNHFPQYYQPPHNQRFGTQGPQGFPPYGYPPMPYGSPPPGWYPPPGQNFPHPPPGQGFYHSPGPFGPPGQPSMQHAPPSKPEAPAEHSSLNVSKTAGQEEDLSEPRNATVKLPNSSTVPVPAVQAHPQSASEGPPPPTESKPNVVEALAPPAPSTASIPSTTANTVAKPTPAGQKSGRIMPAVPIMSAAAGSTAPVNGTLKSDSNIAGTTAKQLPPEETISRPSQVPTRTLEDANRDARAAVAAAMAKLPPAPGQQKKQVNGESAMDNLTNKVNEMRTNDNVRIPRQQGTGGYAAGHRGGRSSHRGGRSHEEQQTKRMQVPKTDYNFAEANAKFNKQDLVKEAIASGDSVSSPVNGSNDASAEASVNGTRRESEASISTPAIASYNKASSFFDNISSESKDRDDKKLGGREFRSEERTKNLETFGQGSVDNNYRGSFRGRGRGRGYRGQRGNYASRGTRGPARGRGAIASEG